MQFSTLFAAAALNSIVAAVQLTNTVYNDITAGKPYSIGWSNATGPVTLTLKNGPALQLKTVSVITSGATTSPYIWDVPANLPADTYAIEISDGSPAPASPNYGPQFQLLGATASASASTASSTGSATGSTTASSGVSTSTTLVGTTTAANSTSSTATGASNSTASATGSSSGTGASNSASKTTAAGGSKTSAAASSSSSVPATNSATEFASPLALVFLTFAAIFTLN